MTTAAPIAHVELPQRFTDVVYLTGQGQMPPIIEQVLKQKKLSFLTLPIESFPQIVHHLDLIGTVIIDEESLSASQQQEAAEIVKHLETEDVDVFSLNNYMQLSLNRRGPLKVVKTTRRRTFGIWFYGIVFLIVGLLFSLSLFMVLREIITLKSAIDVYPTVYHLYAVGFAISAFVFLLLGMLTLSRKGRGPILAICSFLTLGAISIRIWCAYSIHPCTALISTFGSAPVVLFFTSTLCFFIRAKVKNQFKYVGPKETNFGNTTANSKKLWLNL